MYAVTKVGDQRILTIVSFSCYYVENVHALEIKELNVMNLDDVI